MRPLLLASVCLLLLVVSAAQSQDPRPSAGSPPLVVTQCRIQLLQEASLASQRAGLLDTVSVREGDQVEAGQVVIRLRDEVVRASTAVAEAQASSDIELRYSDKLNELARTEYARAVQANHQVPGTIPDVEMRKLRMAAQKSLLQIENSQFDLAIAGMKFKESAEVLKSYQVTAPFDGIVTKVLKKRGEAVQQGEPIMEIVNTGKLRVEGYLSVRDSYRVQRGARVQVQLDIPGVDLDVERTPFPGRVEFVDVKVQAVTHKVRFWAEVVNRDEILRDGLMANMLIDTAPVTPPPLAGQGREDTIRR